MNSPQAMLLDELWSRSTSTSPALQSPCLFAWHEAFASDRQLFIPHVEDDGQWSAALPLVAARQWKGFSAFELPANPWMQCGELLIDAKADQEQVYTQLARQIRSLPGSFVRLDSIFETPQLLRLIEALERLDCEVFRQDNFTTGRVRIEANWDAYLAGRSKGHRKHMRRSLRQLEQLGAVQFERLASFEDATHLQQSLDEAMSIEHLGWKRTQGTSLLANPRCRDFYVRLCHELAQRNMLELLFLRLGQRRIAFEIGFHAKGTWYSHKVSFDPEYARFSPGQLLFWMQLKHWHETREVDVVETVGEMSPAVAKWCNESRPRYRYLIATGGRTSRALLRGLRVAKPWLRRKLRGG